MMLILVLLLGAVTPEKELQLGEAAYDDYRYPEAIAHLRTAADGASDSASRQKARCLLAFSLYLAKREGEAKVELERLFLENENYPLDRDVTPPKLVALFDSVQVEVKARPKARIEPEPPVATKPVVLAPQTVGDRHPWVRIFPAGIGHFCNHDFIAGGIFLGLELGLVATNVGAGIARHGLRDRNGDFREGTNPVPLQIVMNVAAIAAITLAVIDIIDAFVWSPARGRATLAPPIADLGPLGTYRLVFAP